MIEGLFFQTERLAGAVGLEPTPASLTVRCPTNWTTPQPHLNSKCSNVNFHAVILDVETTRLITYARQRAHNLRKALLRTNCEGSCKIKAEERKPAQPSIPEGILGFLSSDTETTRIRFAKLKPLKTQPFTITPKVKTPRPPVKFGHVFLDRAKIIIRSISRPW